MGFRAVLNCCLAKGAVIAVAITLASCTPHNSSDPMATPPQRKFLGSPKVTVNLEVNAEQLNTSMAQRRQYGWNLLARVNTPVNLAGSSAPGISVPAWVTWYTEEEIVSMMQRILFYHFSAAERKQLESQDPNFKTDLGEIVERVLAQHDRGLLSESDNRRYDKLVERIAQSIDQQALMGSVNTFHAGTTINFFNKPAARHILENLPQLHHCEAIMVINDQKDSCLADHKPSQLASCLSNEFPKSAMVVKTIWGAAELDIPVFDSSPQTLEKTFSTATPTWQSKLLSPSQRNIERFFRVKSKGPFGDHTFELLGMHITTKETPEWTWATFWWSVAASGNQDFGFDRPSTLMSEWSQYKMCINTGPREQDSKLIKPRHDETGSNSFTEAIQVLIRASGEGDRNTPWPAAICSNPYLERAVGWAKSNCLGCHQHAEPVQDENFDKLLNPTLCWQRPKIKTDFLWSINRFRRAFRTHLYDQPQITRIISNNCERCHGSGKHHGELSLSTLDQLIEAADRVICAVEDGQMPPAQKWQNHGEKEYLLSWLKARGFRCANSQP